MNSDSASPRQAKQVAGSTQRASVILRAAGLMYALTGYVMAVLAIGGLIAFCFGMLPVMRSHSATASGNIVAGLAINVGLILLFGLQHSVMARQSFKNWQQRLIPFALERSTYVWATNIAIILLLLLWEPLNVDLLVSDNDGWRMTLHGISALGWVLAVISTFQIDHLELFGMKQAWCWFARRQYRPPGFQISGLYRVVRHPLQLGILCGIWATPDLNADRLLFAGGMTAYVLIGLHYEERALTRQFAGFYETYQRKVPMLLPRLWNRR